MSSTNNKINSLQDRVDSEYTQTKNELEAAKKVINSLVDYIRKIDPDFKIENLK